MRTVFNKIFRMHNILFYKISGDFSLSKLTEDIL
jgi:hypothetical protein